MSGSHWLIRLSAILTFCDFGNSRMQALKHDYMSLPLASKRSEVFQSLSSQPQEDQLSLCVTTSRGFCCPGMFPRVWLLRFTLSNCTVAASFLFYSPIQHNLQFTVLFQAGRLKKIFPSYSKMCIRSALLLLILLLFYLLTTGTISASRITRLEEYVFFYSKHILFSLKNHA